MSRTYVGQLYRLELNIEEFEGAIVEAFGLANEAAVPQFARAIQSNWYAWPRVTQRRKGTAGSPRNIVDLGQLLNSYSGAKVSPSRYSHFWAADYALYVHEGAKLRGGTVLPPRRWTEEAFKRWSFSDAVASFASSILERRLP